MTRLYIFVLFFSVSLWAQKPIETDRPDQTETTKIVPAGKFQAESGFLHQRNNVHDNEYQLPETLLKFGLNSKLELRLIATLAYQKVNDSVASGLEPITIGFKLALWKQHGLLPQTSVIGHLQLSKIATSELKEDYLSPEVRLLFLNKVSKNIEIGYNLGAEWNGQSGQPEYAYTLAPDFKLGSRLSAFVEAFGYLPQKQHADHWADAGFKYLITNNIQVDLSGGYELSSHHKKHSYFESVGLSFRL